MFDEFVLRVTGQKKVTDVNVEVGVIMTAGSLMRTEQAPAMLAGFGPIVRHLDGGLTIRANGQGLCGRSHTLKHLPGWCITADKHGDIVWKTPTGHRYNSKRPPIFEYRPDPGHLRQ